jgi:oxalate decarboxylase/phosphoglucose isomerase-like protein (cupin superfamily)
VFTLSYFVPFSKSFGATTNNAYNAKRTRLLNSNTSLLHNHSPHTFNLDAATPQFLNAAGSQTIASADNFPILSDWAMSAFLVRLNKGGVLEPHWHPNAAGLGYCIGGRAEMTNYMP